MYHLVYAIFYLLSLLPWFVIYGISDCCYILIHYVFGYRKKVVMDNLLIAFPEKSQAERLRIAKDFYHSFTDNFIELIKLVSISEAEMKKRVVVDFGPMDKLIEKHERVQLVMSHNFNWEFANLRVGFARKYQFVVAYKPVTNEIFNKLMYQIRTRFGSKMVSATNFGKDFKKYAHIKHVLVLVADQNAVNTSKAYWIDFFGKKAPFVKGPEKGAKIGNLPVVYLQFQKVKRGYYKAAFELVTDTPNIYADGEITKMLINKIEDAIKKQPSNYLWSHRRWKHGYDPYLHQHISVG